MSNTNKVMIFVAWLAAFSLFFFIGMKAVDSSPLSPQRPVRPPSPRVRTLPETDKFDLDKKCMTTYLQPDCWYEDDYGNKYIITPQQLERLWDWEIDLFLFNNPQSYLYET